MKTKIITSVGNKYLNNDKRVANVNMSFERKNEYKNIEVRNLVDMEKSYYKINTPFGYSFTRSLEDASNMKKYYDKKKAKTGIDFLNVY